MVRKQLQLFSLIVSIFIASAPVTMAQQPTEPQVIQETRGKIYVADQASNQVSVIDSATFEVIKIIAVEDRPHNVNHTPDGNYVLVTNKNINIEKAPSLSIIDVETDSVIATISELGQRIEHVVAPVNNRAYVSEDLGMNAIIEIDLNARKIMRSVPVGVKPHGLWPTPDGQFLFAPNQLSGTVSKIDISSMQVIAESNVGRTPTMVAVSSDGSRAYVSLYGERGLAVLDARNVESNQIQVLDTIEVGERPAQVAVTPDGRYVLVPCEGPGALYVVSTQTHQVVKIIPTGEGAHGVDVSKDSRFAYVSNMGSNSLSIIDLEKLTMIREVSIGGEPAGVDYLEFP